MPDLKSREIEAYLSTVHPWNILFRTERDFSVLDRSRGEYGDPADEVACLTMNYLFFSLQKDQRLAGGFVSAVLGSVSSSD